MLIKPPKSLFLKRLFKDFKGFKLKFVSLIFLSNFFVWIAITGVNNRCLGNLSRFGEKIYTENTTQLYKNDLVEDVSVLINMLESDYEKVQLGTLTRLGAEANFNFIIEHFILEDDPFNYWIEKTALPKEEIDFVEKKKHFLNPTCNAPFPRIKLY